MKKQQYVAAVACLVAGAIGFASVYATEKAQEKRKLAQLESVQHEEEELSATSNEIKPQPSGQVKEQATKKTPEVLPEREPEVDVETVTKVEPEDSPAIKEKADVLHFSKENGIVWPLEGEILMDYSMDSTVYFATLEQYKCNPALIISGAVNDKVFAMARGKVIQVFNSEETGCTVRQDLGDGYIATYGQLKELNFDVGDMVESGQVIGYVGEPTKYYSVEGVNVYFALEKDGKPVNPKDYLPKQTMDTLE